MSTQADRHPPPLLPPLLPALPCLPVLQIYDQAVRKVPERERLGVYDIYVARASEFFGIGKVGGDRGRGRSARV